MTAPLAATGDTSGGKSLRRWLVASAAIHAAAVAALVLFHPTAPERPPVYRIEIIGAPGLKKQIGVVADQQPVETAPAPTPAPPAAERPPEPAKPVPPRKTKEKPVPKPQKATPNIAKPKDAGSRADAKPTAKAAPPVAGSGSKTGKGTDVTNMVADGIAFPYPVYLTNIVRQIKVRFDPPKGSAVMAEVKFLIHRDGRVSDIEVLTRSGNSEFDREARGAIEAAGNSGAFGSLPAGFSDDVLPVYFTFSPEKPNPGP
jgi:TonB family protein